MKKVLIQCWVPQPLGDKIKKKAAKKLMSVAQLVRSILAVSVGRG